MKREDKKKLSERLNELKRITKHFPLQRINSWVERWWKENGAERENSVCVCEECGNESHLQVWLVQAG